MNEKIKELIEKSDLEECIDDAYLMRDDWQPFIEQFAELIVRECAHIGFNAVYPEKGISVSFAIKEHFGVK